MDLGGPAPGDDKDPTAVLIRRYLAYLVDALLLAALAIGVLWATAESDTLDGLNRELEAEGDAPLEASNLERFKDMDGTWVIFAEDAPVVGDDRIVLVEQSDRQRVVLAYLAGWVLLYVGLQGFTGATVGKAAAGIRALKRDGSPPGIVRALGRSILLPIDAIPSLFIPVVGPVVALITAKKGHKRLGDLVGGTYVVDKDARGAAIRLPGDQPAGEAGSMPLFAEGGPPPQAEPQQPQQPQPQQPEAAAPAWAAGAPASTSQVPGEVDWTTEQPVPTGSRADPWAPAEPEAPWGADPSTQQPQPQPGGEAPWGADPSSQQPQPQPQPGGETPGADLFAPQQPAEEPARSPAESAAAAATGAAAAAAEQGSSGGGTGVDGYEPQWDAARGSYIQWDPRREEWLQYSEAHKVWHPIDRPPAG